MRNLKRALSLALAFVMVMSLMIVGTSAKSYTDADKIDNQVAVEILGEIGVMIGNDDGSFAPDRDVTRAEMAVIITRILYGNNMNVDQFKNMNTFTDVPDWAEGFVNLCASLDIIAGRGNGIFDPDATVTTAEAALMLSRALGYFKNNAEFGNDWALAAMKRATQAGIIGGDMVLQANEGLDRDDVAQMTFNTLTNAVPVQYNEVLDVYYNENQGVIYALEFNYLQTLGYKNFSLVYKTNDSAEYGRPATTWGIGSYVDAGTGTSSGIEKDDLTSNGGLIAENVRMLASNEIITVNNTPTYVYSQDTAEKDIYSDLSATVCTKYDWTAFVNGEEQNKADIPAKNSSTDYTYTDKGAVTEIYVDDDAATVTVVEINYYLGQVYSVDDGTTTIRSLSTGGKVLDDRTFATEEFDEDEYVVFTVDYNDDEDFYICEMMAPETVTGEVVRVDQDKDSDDAYIRLDSDNGDKYYYTTDEHMVYDVSTGSTSHPTLNEEYILYMTPAGYVLGFELANEEVPQYLFVKDSDEELKDWVAKVILPDATEPKVDLDGDLDGTGKYTMEDEILWGDGYKGDTNIDELIWDYSVNSSDVYSLTYVPELGKDGVTVNDDLYQDRIETGLWIRSGKAYVDTALDVTAFIVDEDTIFVDTMNNKTYTGYSEVPTIYATDVAYVVEDGVAQIVYILDGEIYDENMIYFILEDDSNWESKKYDGDYYREYEDSYVNGKNEKLMVAYDALNAAETALTEGVLYRATKSFEADGVRYITEVQLVANVNPDYGYIWNAFEAQASGNNAFSIWNDGNWNKYTTNSDTTYVLVEREAKNVKAYEAALDAGVAYTGGFEWSVIPGRLSNLKDDLADYVEIYATVAKAEDGVAELVYIYQITPNYTGDTFNVVVNGDRDQITVTGTGTYDKGDDVAVTVDAKDGYVITGVTVNGEAATLNADGTYTLDIDNIAKNYVIEVASQAIPETYTLTLTAANLFDAKVYLGDGSGDALTPSKVNTSFGETTSVEYQIPQNEDVTIVDANITAGQMNFEMTGDKVIDETALGLENGTVVSIYIDGSVVAYTAKSESASDVKIPAADGTKFLVDTKTSNTLSSVVTDGKLRFNSTNDDRYLYTAYEVDLNDAATATLDGKAIYTYVAKDEEIVVTFPVGTYKVNGEVVTYDKQTAVPMKVTGNITVEAWQTAEELAKEIADQVKDANIVGKKTGVTISDLDLEKGTVKFTITTATVNSDNVKDTGLMNLALELVNDGCTIKVYKDSSKSEFVTISEATKDQGASLKTAILDYMPGAGVTKTIPVEVVNAYGQTVTYTITVVGYVAP